MQFSISIVGARRACWPGHTLVWKGYDRCVIEHVGIPGGTEGLPKRRSELRGHFRGNDFGGRRQHGSRIHDTYFIRSAHARKIQLCGKQVRMLDRKGLLPWVQQSLAFLVLCVRQPLSRRVFLRSTSCERSFLYWLIRQLYSTQSSWWNTYMYVTTWYR